MNEYHTGHLNYACDRNHLDPLKEIYPFLKRIGWNGTAVEYFQQKYEFESQYIDYELLKKIQIVRKQGIKCYIASNQDHHRKSYLKSKMRTEYHFDGAFFSCDIGYGKPEIEYWDHVLSAISMDLPEIPKGQIIFLDDMEINIESANGYGMKAIQIRDEEDIQYILSPFLR